MSGADYPALTAAMYRGGMFKKSSKPAADTPDTPKKRSWLKLGLLAAVPLLLAGGGYAGWTLFLAGPAGETAHAAEAGAHAAPDPVETAALPLAMAAETSFTHSYALAVAIERRCGRAATAELKAASEEEARTDGTLVNLSWTSATRRAAKLMDKSCGRLLGEVEAANEKAARIYGRKAGSKDKKSH